MPRFQVIDQYGRLIRETRTAREARRLLIGHDGRIISGREGWRVVDSRR